MGGGSMRRGTWDSMRAWPMAWRTHSRSRPRRVARSSAKAMASGRLA